jgi:type II secretory pathway component PulF
MKIAVYFGSVILMLIGLVPVAIGIFYIWGAFSPEGQSGWISTGIVTALIGFILLAAGVAIIVIYNVANNRRKAAAAANNVTLNVELPGNVKMDSLKCQSCGGTLAPENITMVAGAPVVTCPYCHTTYQLTEEPKW